MQDPHDGPEDSGGAIPPAPAKKAAVKKAVKAARRAPTKEAPAKKAAAKKVPAKKAPAKVVSKAPPALAAKPPQPALEPAPPHAALTAGGTTSPQSATKPLPSVRDTGAEARRRAPGGRARLPITMALAAIGLVAVVLSRFRRS